MLEKFGDVALIRLEAPSLEVTGQEAWELGVHSELPAAERDPGGRLVS